MKKSKGVFFASPVDLLRMQTPDSDCATETLPSVRSETLTELQIRWGNEDDSEIIFLIPPFKHIL